MKSIAIIGLLSITLLSGCATTVKMQVKRAPAISIENTETLTVEPFSVTGNLNLDLVDTKNNLLGAVADIAINVGANSIAETQHKDIKLTHREGLKQAIFQNGHFKVSNASNAQASLSGNINYDVNDNMKKKESKDKEGKVSYWYELNRQAKVSVHLNVNDSKGTMIGSTTLSATKTDRASGNSKNEARNRIEDWSKMVKQALASLHDDTVRKIAPYYVWESRTLAEAKLKIIEKGNDAADDGNWSQAVSLWQEAKATGNNEDQAAALYNLSIYDEKQGKLQDALKKLEQANSMADKRVYARQLGVIKRRIREENQLKKL